MPLGNSIVQRLQRYGTYGRLKQAALRKVAHAVASAGYGGLPSALSAAFNRLDPGGTGRVPLEGLRRELEGGHFALTPAEAEQLLAQVDGDAGGGIDYEEWVAVMADWRAIRDSSEWDSLVAEAFRTLDRDDDKTLGAADLEGLLCGDGPCEIADVVGAGAAPPARLPACLPPFPPGPARPPACLPHCLTAAVRVRVQP